MAWIESHQTLANHPKTRRVARALGVHKAQVIGHLHLLWWWALDYSLDGDISQYADDEIAIAAEWDGDEEKFVHALVQAGFLDVSDSGARTIHNWYDYAGKLVHQRTANRDRMRTSRAAQKNAQSTARSDESQATPTNVQSTCDAQTHTLQDCARLPYQTVPDLTIAIETTDTDTDNFADSANAAADEEFPPIQDDIDSTEDDLTLTPPAPATATPTITRRRSVSEVKERPARWEWLRRLPVSMHPVADWYEVIYEQHPKHLHPKEGWDAVVKLIKRNDCRAIRDEEGRAEILAKHADFKANDAQWQETQYVPELATWINDRGWEGEPVPASSPRASPVRLGRGTPKPPPPTMDEIRRGNQESLERLVTGRAMVL